MRHRVPVALVVIVVAGTALRVAWAAYAARPPAGLHDPFFYRLLADVIAHGHGYSLPPFVNPPGVGYASTAYYPPLYPALLGGVRWITLHTPLPDDVTGMVTAVNLVASIAAIVLVYAIARRLTDERTAIVSAAIIAFWPNLVFHAATTLSETVFLAVMLLAIWLAVSVPWEVRSRPRLIGAGVALGFATLVRPVALPLIGALALAWLVAAIGWRAVLARTGTVGLACVVVIAPWIVRNAVVMGSPVFSTNTGDNLCMSRQPGADGGFQVTTACPVIDPSLIPPASEIRRNDDGQHEAITFVREHPATEIRLWFSRLRAGFSNDADGLRVVESYGDDRFLPDGLRSALSFLANAWYAVVALTAFVSLPFWLRRRDPGGWFLALAAIGVGVVPIVVFFGDPRFHVPMAPFVAILAAGMFSGWARRSDVAGDEPAGASGAPDPVTMLARMVPVPARSVATQ